MSNLLTSLFYRSWLAGNFSGPGGAGKACLPGAGYSNKPKLCSNVIGTCHRAFGQLLYDRGKPHSKTKIPLLGYILPNTNVLHNRIPEKVCMFVWDVKSIPWLE